MKISVLGLTVAGSGLTAGLLYPSPKEKPLNSKKEEVPVSEESKVPVAPKKPCVVYVTKIAEKERTKEVVEITQKIEGDKIENFLDTAKGENFVRDVKGACEDSSKNFSIEDKLNVFVYQEQGGQNKWIYSVSLQKNWLEKSNVKRTFESPQPT